MDASETPHTGNGMSKLEHEGVTWLDVSDPDGAVFDQLAEQYHLNPVHLQESVQKVQHTEVDHGSDYLFLVLRPAVVDTTSGKLLADQIGIFLGKNYLITVHEGNNPIVQELVDDCGQAEQANKYFGQGSAYLLYILIGRILGGISAIAEQIMAELDAIEDQVFESADSDAENISRLRQKIVKLRRIIEPKRLLLDDLTDQIDAFSGQAMAQYYASNLKTANRLWEVVGEAKETVEIYTDADFTTSTEQTNRTLAVLTLIFTFTIPVTVLGTLYGMNILLPGSVNGQPWAFWGSYTTLGLIVALSIAAALAMYLYFRKKRWL
jgi:magnesium transporter